MLESGLLLSTLKADQLVILSRKGMTLPTKIRGMNYINYENNITEVKPALIKQMEKAGLNLTVKKTPPASNPGTVKKTPAVKKPAKAKTTKKSINPNPGKNPPAFI
jgi:hypothetical protein